MVYFARPRKGDKDPAEDSEPLSLLCSGCLTVCSGIDAHVIPWWNETGENFWTTYRCGKCWLKSLDETKLKVNTMDESERIKFCEFLERHKHTALAKCIRAAALSDATRLIIGFLEDLRREKLKLHP